MKREIPLEIIYESSILENSSGLIKKEKLVTYIHDIRIDDYTKQFIKSDNFKKKWELKYNKEDTDKLITMLNDYLYRKGTFQLIDSVDFVSFRPFLTDYKNNIFKVIFHNLILSVYTPEGYRKRRLRDEYLKTIPQNIRDEFGDELLSM